MAMLIAWQTVNAVRRPGSKHFTRGFLVVAPGLRSRIACAFSSRTIPTATTPAANSSRSDMLDDVEPCQDRHHQLPRLQAARAHRTFRRRTGACCRAAASELKTLETEGQMLQRVMPDLMGMKNILVLNDEAHHCYREKPDAE